MKNEPQPDGPLVLIVEDDRSIRGVLDVLLCDEGYRVLTVADGAAGLDVAERERPPVILLDLGLPLLEGPEFCRIYREHGGEAPVILITAAEQATGDRGHGGVWGGWVHSEAVRARRGAGDDLR